MLLLILTQTIYNSWIGGRDWQTVLIQIVKKKKDTGKELEHRRNHIWIVVRKLFSLLQKLKDLFIPIIFINAFISV